MRFLPPARVHDALLQGANARQLQDRHPRKDRALSSNTRRRTILNDFVIRVVASITNQSRRVETMAASLRPTGTTLVRGQRVKSVYVHLTQQLHGRALAQPFAERSL